MKIKLLIFSFFCLAFYKLSFVSGSYCDYYIDSCSILIEGNKIYCLASDVSSPSTCFNISANNITLDCQGYTINYSQSTTGYAINNSLGYDYITIKNCNIVQGNSTPSYSYAIYASGMINSNIFNSTIRTSGTHSYGILISSSSNNNIITNNNITTSGSSGYGIRSDSNSNLILSNNNVTTLGGWAHGIILSSNSNLILTNNRVNTSQGNSLVISGSSISHFNHSIDTSNLAEGFPILYLFNYHNYELKDQDFTNTYGQIIFAWGTNITVDNVTISNDGINFFSVSGSRIQNSRINTSKGRGINIGSTSNYNNITNNNITTSGSCGFGIALSSSHYNDITNNNITTSGNEGSGIYILSSNFNSITNNNITTSGSSGHAMRLESNSNSIISNNNITTSGSYGYGMYLYSGSNNTISNNNIITTHSTSAHAIYIWSSFNNTITNGSYIARGGGASYDYFLRDASTTNNFTSTNFTASRRIYFYDTTSWFNYRNTTELPIWLKNRVDTASWINRTLLKWTQQEMKWNENASTTITVFYEINGLLPNTLYYIYNGTSLTYTQYTSPTGDLTFNLTINTTSRNITVQEAEAPNYCCNSTNLTLAGTVVSHNLLWQDNFGLSHAIFSFDNCTGDLQNISTISLSGNQAWSNFTVIINSTAGCTIRWCVYANDTSNNWNSTSCLNPFSYVALTSIISIELNATKVWWNDSVNASGIARYIDGSPIEGSVSLEVGDKRYNCPDIDSQGNWHCVFKAPNELGSFIVRVKITNPFGLSLFNETILQVSPSYGKRPIGTEDRIVFEFPLLIQDLSGEIKRIFARVIVWRS